MMAHKPILFKNLSLSFPYKTCFEDFNTTVLCGSRIAIIGRNGVGKSCLLKMLQGLQEPSGGEIYLPVDVRLGYVSQVIEDFESLSGAFRFHQSLTKALKMDPNVLLLDEPSNHLDFRKRKSLYHMLDAYPGTLIVASHDVELINRMSTLWHIDNGIIHIFQGNYHDYHKEIKIKHHALEQAIIHLKAQKRYYHQALMQEQKRAKQSKLQGAKHIKERRWPTIQSHAKAGRAQKTSGKKQKMIADKTQTLMDNLSQLYLPEIIHAKFSLTSAEIGERMLVSIRAGSVGYTFPILKDIHFTLMTGERIAIKGDNGSGKSTLLKAILDQDTLRLSGDWLTPKSEDIGYLDQHYTTLTSDKSVLYNIWELVPKWTEIEVRRHLNDFLFKKNEEINLEASMLSGGEKVRLSLAKIAAKTPKLLILDEITNNLDLETREHVIQVLLKYPGAMIVVSHDAPFLDAIGVEEYLIKDEKLSRIGE